MKMEIALTLTSLVLTGFIFCMLWSLYNRMRENYIIQDFFATAVCIVVGAVVVALWLILVLGIWGIWVSEFAKG